MSLTSDAVLRCRLADETLDRMHHSLVLLCGDPVIWRRKRDTTKIGTTLLAVFTNCTVMCTVLTSLDCSRTSNTDSNYVNCETASSAWVDCASETPRWHADSLYSTVSATGLLALKICIYRRSNTATETAETRISGSTKQMNPHCCS